MSRNPFINPVGSLLLLLSLHLALPDAKAAEQSSDLTALASSQYSFELTPGNTSTSLPIAVDQTESVTFRVLIASQTLTVSVVSPGGTRYTVGDPETATFSSGIFPIDSNTTKSGASYQISIGTPEVGNWTLEVAETVGLAEAINGTVTVLFNNSTLLVIAGGGSAYPVNTNIRIAAVVFDNSSKLTGISIDAEIFRPGDNSFPVTTVVFSDDGSGADDNAGDGIYQAFVNLSGAGDYQLQVDASGTASTGVFERSSAALIKLVPRNAQINSFTDQGIDFDFDGLFDVVEVIPSATILKAASYVVGVTLKASNGNEIYETADAVFSTGTGAVGVRFGAEEIISGLGVNGPFEVKDVRYYEMLPGGDIVPADIVYDLGSTGAYNIADLQHDPLSLTGTGDASGRDENGNSLFDTLEVSLQIFADFSGFYDYSVSLIDINGKELGFLNGSTFLDVGNNTLMLEFPGLPIGQNGRNGPFFVSNLLLFNNSYSLISTRALTTPALQAREFEGYRPPVNYAKLRLRAKIKKKIKKLKVQLRKSSGNSRKKKGIKKKLKRFTRKLRLLR